jgi:hypothetical protein
MRLQRAFIHLCLLLAMLIAVYNIQLSFLLALPQDAYATCNQAFESALARHGSNREQWETKKGKKAFLRSYATEQVSP